MAVRLLLGAMMQHVSLLQNDVHQLGKLAEEKVAFVAVGVVLCPQFLVI